MVRADLDGARRNDDRRAMLAAVSAMVSRTIGARLATEKCGGDTGGIRGGGVDGNVLAATISLKRGRVAYGRGSD